MKVIFYQRSKFKETKKWHRNPFWRNRVEKIILKPFNICPFSGHLTGTGGTLHTRLIWNDATHAPRSYEVTCYPHNEVFWGEKFRVQAGLKNSLRDRERILAWVLLCLFCEAGVRVSIPSGAEWFELSVNAEQRSMELS